MAAASDQRYRHRIVVSNLAYLKFLYRKRYFKTVTFILRRLKFKFEQTDPNYMSCSKPSEPFGYNYLIFLEQITL